MTRIEIVPARGALLAVVASVVPALLASAQTIEDVAASNLSSTAAAVTWTTDVPTDGTVNYGTTTSLGSSSSDPRPDDDVHAVPLSGLAEDTQYYYEVVSNGVTDDNGGAFYTFQTSVVGSGVPYVVYGATTMMDGATPATDVLVTVTVTGAGGTSSALTALSDAGGSWALNLGNLKQTSDGQAYPYTPGDALDVVASGAADGDASTAETISGASPQLAATLVLGGALATPDAGGRPAASLTGAPNPFRVSVTLRISSRDRLSDATLEILDVRGRRIRAERLGAAVVGISRFVWDGRDGTGVEVPDGTYFYRVVHRNGRTPAARITLAR